MNNGRVVMLGLLLMSNNIFCEFDKSMNKATTNLYHATVSAVYAAIMIGLSSYVGDFLLSKFDGTRCMENRGIVATGTCAGLYALFLLSAEYQRQVNVSEEQERAYLAFEGEELTSEALRALEDATMDRNAKDVIKDEVVDNQEDLK